MSTEANEVIQPEDQGVGDQPLVPGSIREDMFCQWCQCRPCECRVPFACHSEHADRSKANTNRKRSDFCDLEGYLCWMEEREQMALRSLEVDDLVEGEVRLEKIRFARQQACNFIAARRHEDGSV